MESVYDCDFYENYLGRKTNRVFKYFVKMAIIQFLRTEWYMLLDSDVFLTKKLLRKDIF